MSAKTLVIVAGGLLAAASIARFVYVSVRGDETANAKSAELTRQAVQAVQPPVLIDCPVLHPKPVEIKCTLKPTGKAEVKVCWDLVAECKNGTVARARDCRWVAPWRTENAYIGTKYLKGFDRCDAVTTLKGTNPVLEN